MHVDEGPNLLSGERFLKSVDISSIVSTIFKERIHKTNQSNGRRFL